jgi:hypothetical protein
MGWVCDYNGQDKGYIKFFVGKPLGKRPFKDQEGE